MEALVMLSVLVEVFGDEYEAISSLSATAALFLQ